MKQRVLSRIRRQRRQMRDAREQLTGVIVTLAAALENPNVQKASDQIFEIINSLKTPAHARQSGGTAG